jgi:hypothetical protein
MKDRASARSKGFGLLLDALGDDTYTAHPMPIEFPSPQTAERNVSMAQGAGYGRRADYSDGRSWAGGVGVLIDVQGNDRYLCGVFGQGVGYWGGIGMLIDLQGDDGREGAWYVQGAAAHFAIGYLEDRLGNDRTLAAMNMAIGAGHDFSIGYYIDFAGNDEYNAPASRSAAQTRTESASSSTSRATTSIKREARRLTSAGRTPSAEARCASAASRWGYSWTPAATTRTLLASSSQATGATGLCGRFRTNAPPKANWGWEPIGKVYFGAWDL